MRRGPPVLASSLTRLLRERRDGRSCAPALRVRHNSAPDASVVEESKEHRRNSGEGQHPLPQKQGSRSRPAAKSLAAPSVSTAPPGTMGQSLAVDYNLPRIRVGTEPLLGPGGSRPVSRHKPTAAASSVAVSGALVQPLAAGGPPRERPQSTVSQQDSRSSKVEEVRKSTRGTDDLRKLAPPRATEQPRQQRVASSPALPAAPRHSCSTEQQVAIDGETLVPMSLFEALSLAGKRARERGQHRLLVTPSLCWGRPGSSCSQGPRRRLVRYST